MSASWKNVTRPKAKDHSRSLNYRHGPKESFFVLRSFRQPFWLELLPIQPIGRIRNRRSLDHRIRVRIPVWSVGTEHFLTHAQYQQTTKGNHWILETTGSPKERWSRKSISTFSISLFFFFLFGRWPLLCTQPNQTLSLRNIWTISMSSWDIKA